MRTLPSIFGFIPSVWPVVQRELRARARKPRYFLMRVLGGIAAMLVVCKVLSDNDLSPSDSSTAAFGRLTLLLLSLILVMVPAMTSDCLSKEKRDGTLGLLFLTPLTPAGIVIGKCAAQALMAWSLWLSVLPALAIPLLLGGLTWQNLVIAVVFQFCAVLISLAAGLLASCLAKTRNFALFYAALLTCLFVSAILLLISLLGTVFTAILNHQPVATELWNEIARRDLLYLVSEGSSAVIALCMGKVPPTRVVFIWIIWLLVGMLIAAACIFVVAIWFAARHIRKTWSEKPVSPRQQWWSQRFCTVLFRDTFRRKMRRSLDANPIVWLQQYSWKARITKWGLCLLFILLEVWSIPNAYDVDRMSRMQMPLLLILAAVGTVAGVGSFRSEKESGALELVLITPLPVNKIIFGRVIGWWKQFLPAASIFLLFVAAGGSVVNSYKPVELFYIFSFSAVAYVSLPFFAVYAALRVKYFIIAVALALIGLALEFIFGMSMAGLLTISYANSGPGLFLACTIASSAAFVWLTFFLLQHSLTRRIYSF